MHNTANLLASKKKTQCTFNFTSIALIFSVAIASIVTLFALDVLAMVKGGAYDEVQQVLAPVFLFMVITAMIGFVYLEFKCNCTCFFKVETTEDKKNVDNI